jgi:aminotransferase
MDSMEFCKRLLEEEKVAVIPGNAFGTCGEGYIRCSYAYSKEIITECLGKIANFVRRHLTE